jgi:hypothetical protein
MRLVILIAAFALVALWATFTPPDPRQASTGTSPAMSTALSLCNPQRGIDRNCVMAIAKALIIEQSKSDATSTADLACHGRPGTSPEG